MIIRRKTKDNALIEMKGNTNFTVKQCKILKIITVKK